MKLGEFVEMLQEGGLSPEIFGDASIRRVVDASGDSEVDGWMVYRQGDSINVFVVVFRSYAFNKKGEWWALGGNRWAKAVRMSLSASVAVIRNARIESSRLSGALERQALIEDL